MAASRPGDGRGFLRATFWLGRVRGIRVGINWSVALIFAFIAYGLAASQFPAVNPRQGSLVLRPRRDRDRAGVLRLAAGA